MIRAELHNVRLTYDQGASWALDGITLSIAQGERLCVLGANGSGKSTLAQVLSGLEAPDEGTVELAGALAFDGEHASADAYKQARRHTGLVFQNPEDQIVTSIAADDVAFGPENLGVEHTEIVKRVDEELSRVALSTFADADPARLSGGQQQRLAIAGALAKHGDMLILDEPGAMLDVRGRRGIMRVLDELHASGTTIVHITHFMEEALSATRVIVISAGKIILDGTPAEVFSHAAELKALGLAVPMVSQLSLDLELPMCTTISELGEALLEKRGDVSLSKLTDDAPKEAAAETPAQNSLSKDSALQLTNVSFSYDKAPVISGFNLDIQKGSCTALVGRTGSGKSTLARLMCALAQPQSGAVSVFGIGTQMHTRKRELRATIGYVMQRPERQLFAETVYDDISFGPKNLRLSADEIEQRVEAQLSYLGLSSKRNSSPFELSGGQQRLVALAGVLAMNPRVVVLDEPCAGLDPKGAMRLRTIIRDLNKKQDITVVLISHSMEDVAELADRVCVLDKGTIAFDSTPREVFAHEHELHTLGLGIPQPLYLSRELERQNYLTQTPAPEPLTYSALLKALKGFADMSCSTDTSDATNDEEAGSC